MTMLPWQTMSRRRFLSITVRPLNRMTGQIGFPTVENPTMIRLYSKNDTSLTFLLTHESIAKVSVLTLSQHKRRRQKADVSLTRMQFQRQKIQGFFFPTPLFKIRRLNFTFIRLRNSVRFRISDRSMERNLSNAILSPLFRREFLPVP